MAWDVLVHPDFETERQDLPAEVADKLDSVIVALSQIGPRLGRPLVGTLGEGRHASRHANMKEIRFSVQGVWRFAFAFDVERNAVILCGGDKGGVNSNKFYKGLISVADARFDDWLNG